LPVIRRSPHDREIFRLAIPALGSLAAEPLYILVDTAIVGHLGTRELAALAIAGAVMSSAFSIFNFLAYGTTSRVARLHGAALPDEAASTGVQSLWLGGLIGVVLMALIALGAGPIARLIGGDGAAVPASISYLRIAALGAPFFMLATAGQGYLRGISDLRTPLTILVWVHVLNVVLEVIFVYGFDWGLAGSAWGTVIAQVIMGAAFVRVQLRDRREKPSWDRMKGLMRVGSEIAVRTTALLTSFLIASAVVARIGAASLGAHQIAFQLFVFIALVLDAVAIAGQVIVGRMLGAADDLGARAAAVRMISWSILAGGVFGALLLVFQGPLIELFTDDPAVIEKAGQLWPIFVLMMPANGAVFALDGILIGAGDTRFLMWAMVFSASVFIPIALVANHFGWGVQSVWVGLACLIAARLVPLGVRFRGSRWAVTGAHAGRTG
jgi:putative MATE family efflux protein